jgi:hypothetical protein
MPLLHKGTFPRRRQVGANIPNPNGGWACVARSRGQTTSFAIKRCPIPYTVMYIMLKWARTFFDFAFLIFIFSLMAPTSRIRPGECLSSFR